MLENSLEKQYTISEVEQIAASAAKKALENYISTNMNLDNYNSSLPEMLQNERNTEMSSKYRQQYYYVDANGQLQNVRVNGSSKRETDMKFLEFINSSKPSVNCPTLREFIDEQYRPGFINGLSVTTVSNYEGYLRYYILPFLGEMRMNDVTVVTIQQFFNWMAEGSKHGHRDIVKKTIDRVSGFTSRIFRVAMEMGIIDDSPFKRTLLHNHGKPSYHHKALPDSEVDRVKRAIPEMKDERQRLYMGLLAYTGMRREEIAGLKWEHVHLDEGYGEVKTVVVYPDNRCAVVKDMPKTEHSERTFVIPLPLRQILSSCENRKGYVLKGCDDEKPMSFSTMKRTYAGAFKALGIEGYDNHDWRATFGTQLKETGMSSAIVADLMGHADTRMEILLSRGNYAVF